MCKDGYNLVTCGKCDGEGTVIDGADANEFEATCPRCGGNGKIRMITDTKAFGGYLSRQKLDQELVDALGCNTVEEAWALVTAYGQGGTTDGRPYRPVPGNKLPAGGRNVGSGRGRH